MSSILDALKKADQEATTERCVNTPWQHPAPVESSRWKHRIRRWIFLCLVICISIAGVRFWQTRDTKPLNRETSLKATHASGQAREAIPPAASRKLVPVVPLVEPLQKTRTGNTARQPEQPPFQNTISHAATKKIERPLTALKLSQTANESTSVPPVPSEELKFKPNRNQVSGSKPGKEEFIPRASQPTPTKTETETGRQEMASQVEEKNYRNDQRIDLQALVWAPEPGGRFVVINNQLVREGGSVGSIVVEKINEDDVWLNEGNDQWYQAFTVR